MGYGWGWYKPAKETEEPMIKPSIKEIDETVCIHCNRKFKSKAGRLSHERNCKEDNQ